ncbi:MAG TPA: hypothetical protein VG056_10460, partial [Pirellulales bacterium]|nr:hypothetical protein [Pirellulales bacterium]
MQAESLHAHPPQRRLRWFQYRLRSWLVLMLLAGVGMNWLVAVKNRAERQRAAVEALLKAGAKVEFDYQRDRTGMWP